MARSSLVWQERPALRRPVLVAAFEGWNDAGEAASDAAAWLTRRLDATRFAYVDPEDHVDFREVRPQVELEGGVTRAIRWPGTEVRAASTRDTTHDLVIVLGVEPQYRWKGFCDAIVEVARETECQLVLTLGALLADVPHTRAASVTGAATDPALVTRLGLERSRYEGPTGIVGVLHDACRAAGLTSASLWAPVPHYVAAPPNPPATKLLLDRLSAILGLPVRLGALEDAAVAWRAKVDEVVTGDHDVADYVRQLEARYDAEQAGASPGPTRPGQQPSGDDLAAELEQFLRDQRDD